MDHPGIKCAIDHHCFMPEKKCYEELNTSSTTNAVEKIYALLLERKIVLHAGYVSACLHQKIWITVNPTGRTTFLTGRYGWLKTVLKCKQKSGNTWITLLLNTQSQHDIKAEFSILGEDMFWKLNMVHLSKARVVHKMSLVIKLLITLNVVPNLLQCTDCPLVTPIQTCPVFGCRVVSLRVSLKCWLCWLDKVHHISCVTDQKSCSSHINPQFSLHSG